ncbi:hypothetical protein [Enterovirga aerilata]|uniref:DUF4126 domain-containing protein n=1 Tax=Enterovirga aerilata TaxID=2730920 RepID=A0A849IB31_9HYPH|nr:hypothetical protein [Enterovirga sp. DB1703]NNM74501.1 hypothetical protein [Enterovirga sp. DB1703]
MTSRTGRIFIAGLWAVGLVTGIVLARAPDAIPLPTPAILVPLAVGLLADLAMRPAAESGRIQPLTMNERAIGVIGGALIAIAAGAFDPGG